MKKGKRKDFGLTSKQCRQRFSKKRKAENPNSVRLKESTESKLKVAVEMIKRVWSHKCLRAKYVLCDSWFTCEKLISEVRKLGKGPSSCRIDKMGNAKYLVHGKSHNAMELIALYERERAHNCRQYKFHYISLQGKLGEQPVRIFLIRYGRNQRWNVLICADLSMSFVQAFEVYQIRRGIEVLNKECKQYLGLGKCLGRDFDEQIADCTLCFPAYITIPIWNRKSVA